MFSSKGLIVFRYERGDVFSVDVAINEFTAAITYHNEKFPEGCSAETKRAFYDEADRAAMRQLAKLEDEGRGVHGS